jgi:hypothetical protein
MKNHKPLKWAGVAIGVPVALLASAQLVRPQRVNLATDPSHTIQATFDASNGLVPVLDRACGECHSNTLSSRWYTKVAPFSIAIERGALEGRKAVNFAEWAGYSPEQQRAFLVASCNDARSGSMPLPIYLRFRPDAKLSARDVATICEAAR